MKTLIASAAVAVAALTGVASAAPVVTEAQLSAIQFYAPGADLSGLSASDVASLLSIIHSGDSESEIASTVRAALN